MVLDKHSKKRPTRARALTPADLVVLSLLAEEPMHGYRIVAELGKRDATDWIEISRPQVYYSLKKLSTMGLISGSDDKSGLLGPERDTFKINSLGRSAMNKALFDTSWAEHRPPPPFLTWMALSSHMTQEQTKEMIAARRDYLKKELKRELETLASFGDTTDKMMTAGRLMVSLTVQHFQVELNWLEQVSRELPKVRRSTVEKKS